MDKPICCLEITSSGIKLAVGYVYKQMVYILHALESTRAGLVKGTIADPDQMTLAIRELVNSASKTLGLPITSVVLGLPSLDLTIEQSRAETNTTDPESHVVLFDASNCLAMIMKQKTDDDGKRVVVDVVPYQYTLDKNLTFRSFPNMKISKRIAMAADVEMMDGLVVKSFSNVVRAAGLKIDKIVNVTNAAIKYISSFQKSYSEYIYIDFGARLTTLGYAYDNRLYRAETISYGSESITDALVSSFRISRQKATEYKEIYGISDSPGFEYATEEGIKVADISAVIRKSLMALSDSISGFVLSIDATARNLFIVSGAGADLFGLDAYLVANYQNRVIMFTPTCFGARNKAYTNCVSMLKYYNDYEIKTSPNRPVDLTLTRITPLEELSGPAAAGAKEGGQGTQAEGDKGDAGDERL